MQRLTVLVLLGVVLAAAGAAAQPSASGKQRFTLTGIDKLGHLAGYRVLASGPISGSGTVSARDTSNGRIAYLTLHLTRGNVYLVGVENTYARHSNSAECVGSNTGHGVYIITGGSSIYSGAYGSGLYTRHTILYGSRDKSGNCLPTAPPKTIRDSQTLTGTAALARP